MLMVMVAAGGSFPESVEVVVVRVVVSAELSDAVVAVADLLLLAGDPSLVAALAARPRLGGGGDDFFVQGRPASLANLPKRRNTCSVKIATLENRENPFIHKI